MRKRKVRLTRGDEFIPPSFHTFWSRWLRFPIGTVQFIDRSCSDTRTPCVNVITLTNDQGVHQSPSNRCRQFVAAPTFHSPVICPLLTRANFFPSPIIIASRWLCVTETAIVKRHQRKPPLSLGGSNSITVDRSIDLFSVCKKRSFKKSVLKKNDNRVKF